jgi:hypothetical protein
MFLAVRDHLPPGSLAIFRIHWLATPQGIRPGQTHESALRSRQATSGASP